MSSARYSATLARLSCTSVSNRGHPDATARELGEQLRNEYLAIMREQVARFAHQPDWFRQQLGGREATSALSAALAQLLPDELPVDDRGAYAGYLETNTAGLVGEMQDSSFSCLERLDWEYDRRKSSAFESARDSARPPSKGRPEQQAPSPPPAGADHAANAIDLRKSRVGMVRVSESAAFEAARESARLASKNEWLEQHVPPPSPAGTDHAALAIYLRKRRAGVVRVSEPVAKKSARESACPASKSEWLEQYGSTPDGADRAACTTYLETRKDMPAVSSDRVDVCPPTASAVPPVSAVESEQETAGVRLESVMQGRAYSFPVSTEAAIFIGRGTRCDAVTTPSDDVTVSRVSAILYPQPSHGLLLVCDPGNLSGVRVITREYAHLGLPKSVPFSRNVLPLRWGERAEVDVCGVRVSLFPTPSCFPSAGDETRPHRELDERSTCRICLDRPRSRCFLPCRHQVCCAACAEQLMTRAPNPACPICRSAIAEAAPIEQHQPNRSFAVTRKRRRALC